MEKVETIWLDGKFERWDDATVHVLTHTLHYGFGAFEGIRCYKAESGPAVFRLDEHLKRLFGSCRMLEIRVPYRMEELRDAILQLIASNKLEDAYIRPLVAVGHGEMGLAAVDNPPRVAIAAFHWGPYLGKEAFKTGIRMKVSSLVRSHPNSVFIHGKVCGHYVNNILAKVEAKRCGYDEAILLDPEGYVAEGSGENVFLVRDGVLVTPDPTNHFAGITRDTAIQIARDHGIEVRERRVARDELYIADEVFVTGTAAEVTAVREVDSRVVGAGSPGPMTREIQKAFFDIIRGRRPSYASWLTPVPHHDQPSRAPSTGRLTAGRSRPEGS